MNKRKTHEKMYAAMVALFISLLMPTVAKAQQAYVLEDGATLTFYYDLQSDSRTGTVYSIDQVHSGTSNPIWASSGWGNYNDDITKVVFDASFKDYRPSTTHNWFYNCRKVASIEGIENLNTTNVTDMGCMFWGCESLTSLDVTGFNTEKVTNMLGLFYGCGSLTELDVTGFVTDNVTIMDGMFNRCKKLTTIDVTGFNTENVTDMRNMFLYCFALEWLDLSNFNTEKVTNMSNMFLYCAALKTIYCKDTWTCDESTDMFKGCTSLKGAVSYSSSNKTDVSMANSETGYFTIPTIEAYAVETGSTLTFYYDFKRATHRGTVYDIGSTNGNTYIKTAVFDTSFKDYLPTSTASWFSNCSRLETVKNLDNLNTENVTDMSNMFNGCSALATIYCKDTWTCDESTNMFYGCTSLKGAEAYDASKVDVTMANPDTGYFTKGEAYAVEYDSTLTFYYDLQSESRTGTVYHVLDDYDWSGPNIIKAVFDTSFKDYLPTSISRWFYNCDKLLSVEGLENLNTSKVTNMDHLFYCCYALPALDLSGFETSNLTSMLSAFECCYAMTSLDVTGFDTSNVTNMNSVFSGCESLTTLDVSGFDTSKVTDMSYMFGGCTSLTSLDVAKFNTEKVTDMNNMFSGCSALATIYCNDTWTCSKSTNMFYGCTSLVGAVAFDESKTDVSMANPETGYFTRKDGAVSQIKVDADGKSTGIYNIYSIKMQSDLQSLPSGVYIVDGNKVIVNNR
ncbi:MAG: BspA family leucine-rich repeat surface protein [Candidatus Limisoma sp.]